MIISLIAAVSFNGVIGNNGRIPWNVPEEMNYFKEKTMGHPVIMGRNTFQSIPDKYRPLKGRANIVITRNTEAHALRTENPDGPAFVPSLTDAIDFADGMSNEIFIIGGAQVYKEALDTGLVDRMYINVMNDKYQGDALFPYYDLNEWTKETSTVEYKAFKSYMFYKNKEE
jgi:dihydrofolate reductase